MDAPDWGHGPLGPPLRGCFSYFRHPSQLVLLQISYNTTNKKRSNYRPTVMSFYDIQRITCSMLVAF